LEPDRLRRLPPRFSWIDHRLIRDGHAQSCGVSALALYLVLVTVADRNGVSFYSDRALVRILGVPAGQIAAARKCLIELQLVAWKEPFYQVLSLGDVPPPPSTLTINPPSQLPPASPDQIHRLVQQFMKGHQP
jgi:hypothetical protein